MTKTKEFGAVLARIRRERGFPSAHKFFKGAGGSKGLGLSFVSYWDIERGKKLPKSWRLKDIISSLGLNLRSPQAAELVRAYFMALAGSEELLNVIAPPAARADGDPARTAARRAASHLSVQLTPEQWKARTRDALTNLCASCILETEGWLTVRELAAGAGVPATAVRKSLRILAESGLIELSGDEARGKHAGKFVQLPPMNPATAPIRAALRGNWDAWLTKSKRSSFKRYVVRLSDDDLLEYRPRLDEAVGLAAIYGNPAADRSSSALYLVEGSIFRVFPAGS